MDYNKLQQEGQLEAIAEDLKTSWSKVAGVRRDQVVVTLSQGSLITAVEIKYDGSQGKQQADQAKAAVEDFTMVTEVIKDSDRFSDALGVDKDNISVDEVKGLAEIKGPIKVEEDGGEDKPASMILIYVALGGGILVFSGIVIYVSYAVKKRRLNSRKNQWYHDLGNFGTPGRDSTIGASPGPYGASGQYPAQYPTVNHYGDPVPQGKRISQLNPLSDQL